MTDPKTAAPGADLAPPRIIAHRGQPNPARAHFARTDFRRVQTVFPPGKSIAASVAELMQREGCTSGVIELSGGWLSPFNFVVPAEDPKAEHTVWYSDTRTASGGAILDHVSCSVGVYKGDPYLHCHGLWHTGASEQFGGHLLPDENLIVDPVAVNAILAVNAQFERRFDPETNFELFAVAAGGEGKGLIATVRPNEDITEAIERVACEAGVSEARVHGTGSLIDMTLVDGRVARSLALEVAITGGRIIPHEGGVKLVDLAMAGVGMDGHPYQGLLERGRNRVCVTFELALDAGSG